MSAAIPLSKKTVSKKGKKNSSSTTAQKQELQHGVEYPVFSKGAGVTDDHIKALYRLVKYDKILEEFDYNNIINDLNCNFVEIMERNGIKYSLDDYIFDKRNDICQAANDLNNIINS